MKIWAFLGPGGRDGAKGCGCALGARPPHPRTGPDTTPNPYPNGQNPDKTDVRLGSRSGVGLIKHASSQEMAREVRVCLDDGFLLQLHFSPELEPITHINVVIKTFWFPLMKIGEGALFFKNIFY